ncbi:MAG TPA: hypothetical protein VFX70_09820 [Mycobacteriales bacterium]|nr:hypothetical protein [Mycobacteriales bacterium]
MSEVRRASPSGALLLALLALVVWRPGLPHWVWVLAAVVTAFAVLTVTVGLVREHRGGGGDR